MAIAFSISRSSWNAIVTGTVVPDYDAPECNGPNRMFLVVGLKNKTVRVDPKCPSNNATTSTSSSALDKAQHRPRKHLQQLDSMPNPPHNNATQQPGPGTPLDAATFLPATTSTSTSTGLCNRESHQQGRCQAPAPKALAAGSTPAKDFGSASAIDHIKNPKDLCETKPILSGSPAHAQQQPRHSPTKMFVRVACHQMRVLLELLPPAAPASATRDLATMPSPCMKSFSKNQLAPCQPKILVLPAPSATSTALRTCARPNHFSLDCQFAQQQPRNSFANHT